VRDAPRSAVAAAPAVVSEWCSPRSCGPDLICLSAGEADDQHGSLARSRPHRCAQRGQPCCPFVGCICSHACDRCARQPEAGTCGNSHGRFLLLRSSYVRRNCRRRDTNRAATARSDDLCYGLSIVWLAECTAARDELCVSAAVRQQERSHGHAHCRRRAATSSISRSTGGTQRLRARSLTSPLMR